MGSGKATAAALGSVACSTEGDGVGMSEGMCGRLSHHPRVRNAKKARIARINRDESSASIRGVVSYFFTKIDFGTMQWTPLRMSTIWVMSQSTAIDVSAYAS
jgi:hypothetical protein